MTRRIREQLLRYLDSRTPAADLVRVAAGDDAPTAKQKEALKLWRSRRGQAFYSDLLFALTHDHYPPEIAEVLWHQLVEHEAELEKTLKRRVGIAVAGADFLANVAHLMPHATLIGPRKLARVVEIALQDGLTGLFTHATFTMLLERETARAARFERSFSILMIDVDDFKAMNDTHGHQAGDRVLAALAETMEAELRDADTAARYGGEEFAAILPGADERSAIEVAARIRLAVKAKCGVTISIGVATHPTDGRDPEDLLAAADAALYEAKRRGKDSVVAHRPTETKCHDQRAG